MEASCLPEGSKRIDADGLGRAGVACAIAGDTLEIKLAAAQQGCANALIALTLQALEA